MKFSMIVENQTTDCSRAGDRRIYEDTVTLAQECDRHGFDVFWSVEHTALTYYSHASVPEIHLAYIAAKTERIGIGHGVVCLPPAMNHPVKVAERIAALDILSKGRVHFGVGKGGTNQESGTFGYDLADLPEQIDESMYLIPKIMTQDEIEHDGKYIKIPRREIHPKPMQEPHPPMYLACTNTDTLNKAGARGMGALVLGFGGPEEVAKKNEVYRNAWRNRKPEDQVGFRPIEHLAALCPAIVLADNQKARQLGIRGQRFFMESLAYWYTGGPKPDWDAWKLEDGTTQDTTGQTIIKTSWASEQLVVDFSDSSMSMLNPNHAYGTVKDCIGYVQRLIDAGADEILFICQLGTVPMWAQLETIRNIGTHVIPYFRAKGA